MERVYDPISMGDRMRARRRKLKMSQTRLADKSGTTLQYIYQVENAIIKSPGTDTMVRIANSLRVSLDWLVYGEE